MPKPITLGAVAPLFSLNDAHGTRWDLKEALAEAPVFLVFYPGDLTPGCTVQLCALRDDWSVFQKMNIRVVGINPGGQKGHALFSSLYKLPFPLLVDDEKSVAKLYGVIRKRLVFELVQRTVIGIDKSGIIRYIKEGMPKPAELVKEASKWEKR